MISLCSGNAKQASEKVNFEEHCLETESMSAILNENVARMPNLKLGVGGETGGGGWGIFQFLLLNSKPWPK